MFEEMRRKGGVVMDVTGQDLLGTEEIMRDVVMQ
jgi:hypothetical protein